MHFSDRVGCPKIYRIAIANHTLAVIQGTADVGNKKLDQDVLNKTLEFCANAFEPVKSDEDKGVAMEQVKADPNGTAYHPDLSEDQVTAVNHIRARKMMRTEDTFNIDSFGNDAIAGYVPHLQRGMLTLRSVGKGGSNVPGQMTTATGMSGEMDETAGVNVSVH